MQLVLRVPRASRQPDQAPAAAPAPASSGGGSREGGAHGAADTAMGVDGIELREQTHEEALLSTIGMPQTKPVGLHALAQSLGPCRPDLAHPAKQ